MAERDSGHDISTFPVAPTAHLTQTNIRLNSTVWIYMLRHNVGRMYD